MGEPSVVFKMFTITIYSDGSTQRSPNFDPPPIPACPDPPPLSSSPYQLRTIDVTIDPVHGTCARFFLPSCEPAPKLPILLYFHGGAFIDGSSTLPPDHTFLCKLASHARILIIGVNYRLAPEHPLPAAYEDGVVALKWLSRQAMLTKEGCSAADPWLAKWGDFSKCYLGGDSAGANLAHHVAMVAGGGLELAGVETGKSLMEGLHVEGMIMIHSFFSCGEEDRRSRSDSNGMIAQVVPSLWRLSGVSEDHPFANPMGSEAPALGPVELPPRILVAVASNDFLTHPALAYHKALLEAGKNAKLFVSEDEDHVFHLFHPDSKNVPIFLDELKAFIDL